MVIVPGLENSEFGQVGRCGLFGKCVITRIAEADNGQPNVRSGRAVRCPIVVGKGFVIARQFQKGASIIITITYTTTITKIKRRWYSSCCCLER